MPDKVWFVMLCGAVQGEITEMSGVENNQLCKLRNTSTIAQLAMCRVSCLLQSWASWYTASGYIVGLAGRRDGVLARNQPACVHVPMQMVQAFAVHIERLGRIGMAAYK